MQWYKDNDNDDDNDDEATAVSKQSGISHTAEIPNLTANTEQSAARVKHERISDDSNNNNATLNEVTWRTATNKATE